ncbi:hypothetical protein CLOM_g5891 [Closterium sp. NIES-68]|nr:hypothetical protein CLOM_g5891 [Closterium sp. NIES-68]GJP76451.1 hypothetical protein CLOP_g6897 [Closterium sp. NIES-67]
MSRIVGRGGTDPYSRDVEMRSSTSLRSSSSLSSTPSAPLAHSRSGEYPHAPTHHAFVSSHNEYADDSHSAYHQGGQFHSYASGSTIVPYAYPPPPPPEYPSGANPAASYPPVDPRSNPRSNPHDPARKPRWYKRVPWLALTVIIACIAVFTVTMAVNNCPSKPHPPGQSCVLPWLGRFSFEPLNINPLFGPTALTLQDMGALNSNLVTNYHQGWRLVTAMWLHGGMVHLFCNLLAIGFLLNRLEKEFGLWRPSVIYLLSGVYSAVFSCLFLNAQISVGASGALFGLVGACLSELLMNWKLYDNRFSALMTLVVLIAINLAIGLLPYIDNFAHIGGCIAGFFLGFALLVKPQLGFIDLRDSSGVATATAIAVSGGDPVTKKYSTCQVYTRIISGICFIALFAGCMAVLFTKGNVAADCSWCRYMSCVPTPWWTCDPNAPGTQAQGPVCQVRSYQNGTGALVCTNQTMLAIPNITSMANYDLRVLCTQACS